MPTLVFVPKPWPRDEFLDHLAALRKREGIKDQTEMMRIANLDPSLHTNWAKGRQPTIGSLDKLAEALNVQPKTLYVAAGRIDAGQLGSDSNVELPVLPREFDELIDLYLSASDANRTTIVGHVAFAVRGLRALFSEPAVQTQPTRRRSA